MRIALPFSKDEKKYYENARVWHNLCRTCDFLHIETTDSIKDGYDILHIVNLDEEHLVDQAIAKKIPIVATALCSESDDSAILVEKDGYYRLKNKALRVLNKVTAVIVPSDMARIILKHAGVEKPIYVVSEGVDASRIKKITEGVELSLFYRYFAVKNDNPVVVSSGTYEEKSGIIDYVKLAKEFPNVNFFWFGKYSSLKINRNIKKILKNHPQNLWLENIVDENVFLSVLAHSSIYCIPGTKIVGTVTILDALSAKCQIVARDKALLIDNVSQNKITYICKSYNDLRDKINIVLKGSCLERELEKIMKEFSIENIAHKLMELYNLLLENKDGKKEK